MSGETVYFLQRFNQSALFKCSLPPTEKLRQVGETTLKWKVSNKLKPNTYVFTAEAEEKLTHTHTHRGDRGFPEKSRLSLFLLGDKSDKEQLVLSLSVT